MGGAGSTGNHADLRMQAYGVCKAAACASPAAGAPHRRFCLPGLAAETLVPLSGVYDTRILLTLGITLGIIAFSIGSALACLRATQAALKARDAATLEAERYRASERMLETILAAEPQVLLTWTAEDGPRVHVANLPHGLGVPSDPDRLLRFEEWLDAASAEELTLAMQALADRGEAFNLMLRTERQRHVEADGRAAGAMIMLKVRDLAGQRLELAGLGEEHRQARHRSRLASRPAR